MIGRIMSIDYGKRRTGIAVSDPMQMIAIGLDTVETKVLWDFISNYFLEEQVVELVVGEPLLENGMAAQNLPRVQAFIRTFEKKYPSIKVTLQDERYTSREAKRTIINSGINKKKRRDKGLVDKIAAVIILQQYIEKKHYTT
mgnify:CR=1 FL=1